MNGDPRLYKILSDLGITFGYHEHPPAPTIEVAMKYWEKIDSTHCKNLFFRNHKGNRHYLDKEKHVHLFLDESLKSAKRLSFHPNINTVSIVISYEDFMKFLNWTGNTWEFVDLKEQKD